LELCKLLKNGVVNAEVVSTDAEGMLREVQTTRAGAYFVSPFLGRLDDDMAEDGFEKSSTVLRVSRRKCWQQACGAPCT